MKNTSIFLMVFGIVTILFGLYIYKGHGNFIKPYNVKKDKTQLKKVGKYTMFVGLIIFILFFLAYLLIN